VRLFSSFPPKVTFRNDSPTGYFRVSVVPSKRPGRYIR
jgi:hypothetical protein